MKQYTWIGDNITNWMDPKKKELIVEFNSETEADKFLNNFEFAGGFKRFNWEHVSHNLSFIKEYYRRPIKIIKGNNSVKFFQKVIRMLK